KLRFSQSAPQTSNRTPSRFENLLARYPVTLRKDRAKALAPLNNIPKRSFQRRNIQRTTQPNRQRHRVGRTTSLQPLQKPQPTLRKRQRNFRRTSNRAQRRTTRPRFPQTLHKPTNRPRFKQAADRNLNTKARSEPDDQTRRKQRVSTQLKKVVLNPNPLDPQNLRKQPAQQLLLRRARKTPNAGAKLRRRQRSSVQLPVRRQRKTIQNNNRRRHHVIGKPRTNMRAQLASFRRTTRSQNNVANKLAAARIAAARNHRSLRYAPMPQKRSLDLPKLNAKSANLNLMVRATHKLQNSIPAPAHQVPAAVHPTPRSPKPIRNKTLRCQTTTTQIPPPNSRTRNVKLPNNPNRHRLQTTIQNVHAVIGQRTTYRDLRVGLLLFDHKPDCIDRRLRRTIKIGDGLNAETSRNLFRKYRREGLASKRQMLQRGILRSITNDRFQVGRHATHKSHVIADQLLPHLRRRFPHRITDDDNGSASDERHKRLLNRSVESTGNDKRRSETTPQRKRVVPRPGVLDRHAFWGSGGAGGVDDVGEVLRPHGSGGGAAGLRRNRRRRAVQFEHPRRLHIQAIAQRRMRDQNPRAGIRQHEGEPLRRVAGVERQIGAAGLENAEQPHHHLQQALKPQPNHPLPTHPQRAQMLRQLVGARLQLRIAERLLLEHNRNRIRRLRGLRRKQLRNRLDLQRTSRRVPILQQPAPLFATHNLKPPNR